MNRKGSRRTRPRPYYGVLGGAGFFGASFCTGATAFGAKFVNQTAQTLNSLTVHVTGELWRQSDLPKTLECYYWIDPTGTAPFSGTQTASLPDLNVSFAVNAAAAGGVAVDGTAAMNQISLTAANEAIADWPPGAALWLVWQMPDSTGKAQGLAVDNLSFSASTASTPPSVPLSFQTTPTNLVLSWFGVAGQNYQLEYKNDLAVSNWTAVGTPISGMGVVIGLTNDFDQSAQRFYRLRTIP